MRLHTRSALQTVLLDTISIVAAGTAMSQYVFKDPLIWNVPNHLTNFQQPWPMAIMLLLGVMGGSWQSTKWVEPAVARPIYARAFATGAIALATVLIGNFSLRTYYSRVWVPLSLVLWLSLALTHRALSRRQAWREQMAVVTDEKGLAHELAESAHAEVVELWDPRGEPPATALAPNTTLVVDLTSVMSDGMARFVSSSTLAGYEVRALSNVYEEHTGRVALVHLAEGWEISVPLDRRAAYATFKRLLETLLIVATAPLWLSLAALTWVAIRIDSSGPAVFRQQRTGLDDLPFTMYKFRTMVLGADDDGPQFTTPDDPRITRIGRFLRSTRLDEIPQLFNVLAGDAALVGPRAEQVAFARQFEDQIPFYRYRHLVRPGITGWAQVHYGYADDVNDTIEKLTYDLYYVRHMSPWLDFSILAKTLITVVKRSGSQ